MNELFLKVVNMSISASWLVLAVLALRLILKRSPKWVNVLLWGIVALRLVIPFSFESALSLIPSAETIPANIEMVETPTIDSGISAINGVVNPVIGQANTPAPGASINPLQGKIAILAAVWAIGAVAMLAYTVLSYWRLRRKVSEATLLRDNIYQCESVASPFVLGIVKPRIYLSYQIDGQDLNHVVAHEQAHIRRKDHWWKPLGFLLLTVHWFNPLMWLAYVLLCRDIELACDEKVIKELGNEQRADYSQALLSCSVNRRMIAACPLAFGEVGVKERVKSVMNYRKPAFWVVAASVVACVAVAVCFLTDPSTRSHLMARDHGKYLEISCRLAEPIRSFAIYEDIYEDGTLVSSEPRLMDNFVEEGGATSRSFNATLKGTTIKKADGGYEGALELLWESKETSSAEWTLDLPGEHYTNHASALADGTRDMFMELDVEDNDDILLYSILLAKNPAGMITGIDLKNGIVKTNDLVVQYRLVTSTGPLTDFQKFTFEPEVSIGSVSSPSVHWTFSPMMSATWHGFFYFNFDSALNYSHIEASCDTGTLHNLDVSGQPKGTELLFAAGEPIYWSPTAGDDLNDTAAHAAIRFTVYDGEEMIYSGTLNITRTGTENGQTFYEATLGGTDLLALQQADNSAVVVRSDRANILAYADLNHNGITEHVIVNEAAPNMLYELRVEENGEVIWSTEAAPAHVGWNTVMLYNEDGKDYLVQYLPAMFQGMGSYTCSVFSLEGNQQTVKNEWSVEFNAPFTEKTAEMEQFAEEVGLLLRKCHVLLSTEQGIVVKQYTAATDLAQLYPVRFDPEEIWAAIDGIDQEELTADAAQFPSEPLEFLFCSGAGAWGTTLTLHPDGSFTGHYRDSEMGSSAPDHPNALCYTSHFQGSFSEIRQRSDHSWSMQITDLTTEQEVGETWTEEGILYIASEPHGLTGGEEFILYAPGTPADQLSEDCRYWWPDWYLWSNGEKDLLDCWCICNVNTGHGFFSN